jgi:hypothetical protein
MRLTKQVKTLRPMLKASEPVTGGVALLDHRPPAAIPPGRMGTLLEEAIFLFLTGNGLGSV